MHLLAATIRTDVMLPLRFAAGFCTTARAYTFDWLADGRERLPVAWPAAVASADLEVPPLVRIHGECFTGDVLGSEQWDCAQRSGAQTLGLPCDDVLDAVAYGTARPLLSCHLGRTNKSWWCTVTDRWPADASARRRLAYDGACARSSGCCSHAPASQPVNQAAARAT